MHGILLSGRLSAFDGICSSITQVIWEGCCLKLACRVGLGPMLGWIGYIWWHCREKGILSCSPDCWLLCFNQTLKAVLFINTSQAVCLGKATGALNIRSHKEEGREREKKKPFGICMRVSLKASSQIHSGVRNWNCLGVGVGRAVWLKH